MASDFSRLENLPGESPSNDLSLYMTGLVKTLSKEVAGVLATHGLLPLDFALLRLFLDREPWTVTQLAQVLPVQAPRISRVVTNLVNRRLIRRRRLRSDRRVVFLTLTDEGKTLAFELYQRILSWEATLSQGVSEEEMEAFVSVAPKVVTNYGALEDAG